MEESAIEEVRIGERLRVAFPFSSLYKLVPHHLQFLVGLKIAPPPVAIHMEDSAMKDPDSAKESTIKEV